MDAVEPTDERPLVSVGFPVRNGGDAFPLALASVLGQTYTNLEIVLSDNASDDGTTERCAAAAAADPRVRHIRHAEAMRGLDHFRWVFEQTSGEYFLWAAHDDLRSPDYVEVLLGALQATPDAGLAFGDLYLFHDYDDLGLAEPLTRIRGTEHGGLLERCMFPWRSCLPIYGMFRRDVLARYDGWTRGHAEFGGDLPIIAAVGAVSEILQVPGTAFYYWGADHDAVRADRKVREKVPQARWRYVRLNWAITDAMARSAGLRTHLGLFAYLQARFSWWRVRGLISSRMPSTITEAWRRRADGQRARRAEGRQAQAPG